MQKEENNNAGGANNAQIDKKTTHRMADHTSDFTARAHINVAKKKKKKPTWRSSLSVSYDSHKNGPKVLNSP